LHVEILYNEYNYTAAFAVASLLALLALLTLAGKTFLERQEPELRHVSLPARDRTRRNDP
jgi:sulfate/thiosulfate transport system permease protein